MPRKKTASSPQLERRTLQQVVMWDSARNFTAQVNELLLDGWEVVPGTTSHSTSPAVANARTPAEFIDNSGLTYRHTYFVALRREELVDPEAAKRAIEAAEGRELVELEA